MIEVFDYVEHQHLKILNFIISEGFFEGTHKRLADVDFLVRRLDGLYNLIGQKRSVEFEESQASDFF